MGRRSGASRAATRKQRAASETPASPHRAKEELDTALVDNKNDENEAYNAKWHEVLSNYRATKRLLMDLKLEVTLSEAEEQSFSTNIKEAQYCFCTALMTLSRE